MPSTTAVPNVELQQHRKDRQKVYFMTTEGAFSTEADTSTVPLFYRDSDDADEDSVESFGVNSSGLRIPYLSLRSR